MPETLTYLCPFCGSDVRVGIPCLGCAKKTKKRSWEQPPSQDGLDLPDDDFDYDDFIQREFGKLPHRRFHLPWYWWALGVCLILTLLISVFWPR
jgi:hypothetical protein